MPEMRSAIRRIVNEGIREAGNFPEQSGAAGIVKKAMAKLMPYCEELCEAGYICRPLMQIHDELLFEVSDEIINTATVLFIAVMENCVELSVPITVEAKVGKSWGRMEKWE